MVSHLLPFTTDGSMKLSLPSIRPGQRNGSETAMRSMARPSARTTKIAQMLRNFWTALGGLFRDCHCPAQRGKSILPKGDLLNFLILIIYFPVFLSSIIYYLPINYYSQHYYPIDKQNKMSCVELKHKHSAFVYNFS